MKQNRARLLSRMDDLWKHYRAWKVRRSDIGLLRTLTMSGDVKGLPCEVESDGSSDVFA